MADANQNQGNRLQIYDENAGLQKRHYEIQIKEKQSVINALRLRRDDVYNIEISRIDLEISFREIEFEKLKIMASDFNKSHGLE